MSDGVVIAIISSFSAVLLAIVNAIIAAAQRHQAKKSGTEERIERIEEKVDKLTVHNDLQYMSLLRLTVMDSDMPMSERLIAGREYLDRNGNGDVKAFYQKLEREVNGNG